MTYSGLLDQLVLRRRHLQEITRTSMLFFYDCEKRVRIFTYVYRGELWSPFYNHSCGPVGQTHFSFQQVRVVYGRKDLTPFVKPIVSLRIFSLPHENREGPFSFDEDLQEGLTIPLFS